MNDERVREPMRQGKKRIRNLSWGKGRWVRETEYRCDKRSFIKPIIGRQR